MPNNYREARQLFSSYKFQILCKTLKKYDDEDNNTPIHVLCKKVGMTKEIFLQHYDEAAFFHEEYEDGSTYGQALDKLQKQRNEELRRKTMLRLKQRLTKPRQMPSVQYISRIGQEVLKEFPSPWISCSCKRSWAQAIQHELWPQKKKGKKLNPMVKWIEEHLSQNEFLENNDARKKYSELYGPIKSQKAWSSFSSRIRKQLSLKVATEVKTINGKKVQQFLWHK